MHIYLLAAILYDNHSNFVGRLFQFVRPLMREYLVRKIALLAFSMFISSCDYISPLNELQASLNPRGYFKLIDQDGKPVKAARMEMIHGGNSMYFGSNETWKTYISDESGIIRVDIDSRQLTLSRVASPGYVVDIGQFRYNFEKHRNYPVGVQGDFWSPDWKIFSEENPIIIPFWKLTESEIRGRCINGVVEFAISPDGSSYGINFRKPMKEVVAKNDEDRPLQITFKRLSEDTNIKENSTREIDILKQNWIFTLRMTGAGRLVEIDQDVIYKKRPSGSNLKEWSLTTSTFRPRSNAAGGSPYEDDRHFYIHGMPGLGRMSIRFTPAHSYRSDTSNGKIMIDYSISENGYGIVRGVHDIGYSRYLTSRTSSNISADSCLDPWLAQK